MMILNKAMSTEMVVNDVKSPNTSCMGCGSLTNIQYYNGKFAGRKKSFIICDRCVKLLEESLTNCERTLNAVMGNKIIHPPETKKDETKETKKEKK